MLDREVDPIFAAGRPKVGVEDIDTEDIFQVCNSIDNIYYSRYMDLFFNRTDGHVIISGTGRAGTTLLVQYFTCLGLDTGFRKEDVFSSVDSISHAGLEHDLSHPDLPTIIKSPWFADSISGVLADGSLKIDAAIIPIRSLENAAESRRRVFWQAKARGLNPLSHPGSIWKTKRPADQEPQLAVQFHRLVDALVRHHIPMYFVPFPSFAAEHDVLYRSIEGVLTKLGISKEQSLNAHREAVNMDLVTFK